MLFESMRCHASLCRGKSLMPMQYDGKKRERERERER